MVIQGVGAVLSNPTCARLVFERLGFVLDCSHFKTESTARVSSRKYFIPGCVGRGLDLDLRIRPAAAPAAAPAPPAASGPKWVGPSWAHVGGPKLGPSGWAQAGPKWVGPGYTDLAPLGLKSKKRVFERPG